MAAVPEEERVAMLRELGASESLIRLACGEDLHPQLSDGYKGPPWYLYHGEIGAPKGFRFCGLWEFCDRATGVRKRRRGGIEFIRYAFGSPDEYTVLARSEQGFWAVAFDFLYEADAPLGELREVAEIVEFRYLDRFLATRAAIELDYTNFHDVYLRRLVRSIDREENARR
jgi:hypothetical protein